MRWTDGPGLGTKAAILLAEAAVGIAVAIALGCAHRHPNPRRSALGYRRGAGRGAAKANTAEPAAIADTGQLGSNPDAGGTLGAGRPCRSGLSCSDSR